MFECSTRNSGNREGLRHRNRMRNCAWHEIWGVYTPPRLLLLLLSSTNRKMSMRNVPEVRFRDEVEAKTRLLDWWAWLWLWFIHPPPPKNNARLISMQTLFKYIYIYIVYLSIAYVFLKVIWNRRKTMECQQNCLQLGEKNLRSLRIKTMIECNWNVGVELYYI